MSVGITNLHSIFLPKFTLCKYLWTCFKHCPKTLTCTEKWGMLIRTYSTIYKYGKHDYTK